MHRKNFGATSGIIVDICSRHGSYFDAGELPRVLEFVRRGGLARARAHGSRAASAPLNLQNLRSGPSEDTLFDGIGVLDLFRFVVDVLTRR